MMTYNIYVCVIFTDKCQMESCEESVLTAWWLLLACYLFGTMASPSFMQYLFIITSELVAI